MSSSSLQLIYETQQVTVAAWRHVTIFAVREAITAEALRAYVEVTNRLASEGPNCVLSVVGEQTELPGPEVVRAGVVALQASTATCRAWVIPGSGLWATAFKGMVRQALTPVAAGAQETFSVIDEATCWLSQMMATDLRWRLHLTTLAGTLVYGSPSWMRRSQATGYFSPARKPEQEK